MRLDNSVAHVMTGVLVVAMMIVGAELLFAANASLEGDGGLLVVSNALEREYGRTLSWLFLAGFWATSFTSLIGVWNGVSLLFADFADSVSARLRGHDVPDVEERASTTNPWFRGYMLWLTFPPMLLLGEPIQLIIAYGALGAVFLPFLAFTLLWLMNSARVAPQHRNGLLSNTTLAVAGLGSSCCASTRSGGCGDAARQTFGSPGSALTSRRRRRGTRSLPLSASTCRSPATRTTR